MDFFAEYFRYTEETEPPRNYHRWCATTSIGAILGRNYFIQHGHFRVFPNLYTLLIGESGTRKSTAIKMIKRLVSHSGYETFAADKTSKEKFLLDLEGGELSEIDEGINGKTAKKVLDSITASSLWGDDALREIREVFIVAGEFNEFIRAGDIEFCSLLGDLWDWDDDKAPYRQRLKNSRSVAIFQPTISLLGGNTPERFAQAFPTAILGQGFFSRLLLIHGERSDKRLSFPPEPDPDQTTALADMLKEIRVRYRGPATLGTKAQSILDTIYHSWEEIADVRFQSYSTRRFTQLLKLSIIYSVSCGKESIDDEAVILANTVLHLAEHLMPKALGEFGKSKNSDVSNKVMDVLSAATKPMTATEIWKFVHKDLEKISQLGDIMHGLATADRVMSIKGKGWLPKKAAIKRPQFVDFELLSPEERGML